MTRSDPTEIGARSALARRVGPSAGDTAAELLADEAPLELRVQEAGAPARAIAVVMRSRLDDEADLCLATGFLVTEGIVADSADLAAVSHCDIIESPDAEGNVVIARLRAGVRVDWARLTRHTYAASSCGVCGKATIDAVCARVPAPVPALRPLSLSEVNGLVDVLAARQPLFRATGAAHGAVLVDVAGPTPVVAGLGEDVGRHCAVDRAIGQALRAARSPRGLVLVVSGRVAFEIVQKAVAVGASAVVAVGAPTALAVELARAAGVVIVGFVRGGRATWYTGAPAR